MTSNSRPIIHFTKGNHRFEVYPARSGEQTSFLGMYDGRLSVASTDYHSVTRMLLRRHGPRRAGAGRPVGIGGARC